MKRFAVLLLLVSAVAFASPYRLPDVATPERYSLTFTPDLAKATFSGDETISIRVLKPTSTLTLNSAEIEFQEVTVTQSGKTQAAKVTPHAETETVDFAFEKPLAAGPATMHIRYTGILNDQLRGLYLAKTEKRRYATSQFEATDARRAFPSFDEPAFKAVFEVSTVIDSGDMALSNMKQVSDTPGSAGKHTVKFAPSPKMSAYLVALAVGDFECVEGGADGIPIRVCSTPGKKDKLGFLLTVAEACMKYFNQYYSQKYPYGKLDILGMPDFAAGAMENTGLIIQRDVLVAIDEKTASINRKKSLAQVLSHEMAHQWFGDLVTMAWWDDVWLNEGFATWMENKPLQAWKPEWKFDLDEISDAAVTMNGDSNAATRPIHAAHAETPAQIEELFDGIAYGKAAAVLNMVESYVTPEVFKAGVNLYLKRHAYANATAADFWNALTEVSKKPVDKVMASFVNQPGVPMVSLDFTCANGTGTVQLSQQRYFYNPTLMTQGSDAIWQIPVRLITGDPAPQTEILAQKQQSVKLKDCPAWVYGNAGAHGYYRTAYSPEQASIIAQRSPHLSPGERIMLTNDEWAQVQIGRHSVGDYLNVAASLASDTTPQVADLVLSRLERIHNKIAIGPDRSAFEGWVRKTYRPVFDKMGWKPAPDEGYDQRALRATLLRIVGGVGRDPEVLRQAHDLAFAYIKDPSSLDPNLTTAVLDLATLSNDPALYDAFLAEMKKPGPPDHYYRFFNRLDEFTAPALLERTLSFALTPEVRVQDFPLLLSGALASTDSQKQTWEFIKSHWDDIKKRTPEAGGPLSGLISSAGAFCDAGAAEDVQQFFQSHPLPAAERTMKQAQNSIRDCIELRNAQAPRLAQYLQQKGTAAGGSQ
jgi:aminopeptidase N